MVFDLAPIRKDMEDFCESLLDTNALYGSYRSFKGKRCDLYASLDVALIRAIMGEDLMALPLSKREEWTEHINSFSDETLKDGSYYDTFGHSKLHANGMVIGALGLLGGKVKYPCRLYDDFRSIDNINGWLEKIEWENQWPSSHLFWGGMHCYSFSKDCTEEWKEAVRVWLTDNCDDKTGYWLKGTVYKDRHQALGGLAHILPIFEHHNWEFPFIERTLDSVLAMQLPAGHWYSWIPENCPANYLDLDALYLLYYAKKNIPTYRQGDVQAACYKYLDLLERVYVEKREKLYHEHPHFVLAVTGVFGLLKNLIPERVTDDRPWTDIFSDLRLYRTAEVYGQITVSGRG